MSSDAVDAGLSDSAESQAAGDVDAQPAGEGTRLNEMARLEGSLERLLEAFDSLIARATSAEQRVQHLEASLRTASSSGELDPVALANRVHLLEQENRFLARRLDRARESVKRISARLQFLEDDG